MHLTSWLQQVLGINAPTPAQSASPQPPKGQPFKIYRPKDPRQTDQLRRKCAEYEKRIDPYASIEVCFITGTVGESYKKMILQALLQRGVVRYTDMYRECGGFTSQWFHLDEFNNAWGVIYGYVFNGGTNLSGGTGLPPCS